MFQRIVVLFDDERNALMWYFFCRVYFCYMIVQNYLRLFRFCVPLM